jgi:hypothetical protein
MFEGYERGKYSMIDCNHASDKTFAVANRHQRNVAVRPNPEPANFNSARSQCQLERLGAAQWACGALAIALGLLMVSLAAGILIVMKGSSNSPRAVLAAVTGLWLIGAILLLRGWRSIFVAGASSQ